MRYVKLWFAFLNASVLADLEYRMNIVVKIIGEIMWYITQLSVFEVLYLHTPTISGWDVNDMRVFLGTLFLVDCFYMVLFSENMDHLNSLVRRGDLDLYLTKPVNSQFMITFRRVAFAPMFNLFIILGYLSWAIPSVQHPLGAFDFLAYAFLCVSGLAAYYGMRFLFSTLIVILQEASNLAFLWHQFFRLATRPDPVYPLSLRRVILSIFPVAFIASVPARVLIEGPSWKYLIAGPLLSAALVCISHWAWNGALRRYSSASS